MIWLLIGIVILGFYLYALQRAVTIDVQSLSDEIRKLKEHTGLADQEKFEEDWANEDPDSYNAYIVDKHRSD